MPASIGYSIYFLVNSSNQIKFNVLKVFVLHIHMQSLCMSMFSPSFFLLPFRMFHTHRYVHSNTYTHMIAQLSYKKNLCVYTLQPYNTNDYIVGLFHKWFCKSALVSYIQTHSHTHRDRHAIVYALCVCMCALSQQVFYVKCLPRWVCVSESDSVMSMCVRVCL